MKKSFFRCFKKKIPQFETLMHLLMEYRVFSIIEVFLLIHLLKYFDLDFQNYFDFFNHFNQNYSENGIKIIKLYDF